MELWLIPILWVAISAALALAWAATAKLREDRASSASRQHYIDTGRYLTKRQVREDAQAEVEALVGEGGPPEWAWRDPSKRCYCQGAACWRDPSKRCYCQGAAVRANCRL